MPPFNKRSVNFRKVKNTKIRVKKKLVKAVEVRAAAGGTSCGPVPREVGGVPCVLCFYLHRCITACGTNGRLQPSSAKLYRSQLGNIAELLSMVAASFVMPPPHTQAHKERMALCGAARNKLNARKHEKRAAVLQKINEKQQLLQEELAARDAGKAVVVVKKKAAKGDKPQPMQE